MDVRERLIKILRKPIFPHELVDPAEAVADYLLDNGVTVQELHGCKYCNDSSIICNADEEFYISGNTLRIDIGCHFCGSVNINFCPMCGRRLYLPKPTTQKSNS